MRRTRTFAVVLATAALLLAGCDTSNGVLNRTADEESASPTPSTSASASQSASPVTTISSVEDLDKACESLLNDTQYFNDLPAPTRANPVGRPIAGDSIDAVRAELTGAIMEYVRQAPVGGVYAGEMNRAAIFGDPAALSPSYSFTKKVKALTGDKDVEIRKAACQAAAVEVAGLFDDTAKVSKIAAGQPFAMLLFTAGFKSVGWSCGNTVPPSGMRVASWQSSKNVEAAEGSSDAETFRIMWSLDHRALIADKCPVKANKAMKPVIKPAPEEVQADQQNGTSGNDSSRSGDTTTTRKGGGTQGNADKDGSASGGKKGGGPNNCTGGSTCAGVGPGGGNEDKCKDGQCEGGGGGSTPAPEPKPKPTPKPTPRPTPTPTPLTCPEGTELVDNVCKDIKPTDPPVWN